MSLKFTCPHCLETYTGNLAIGEQTDCDSCGNTFEVRRCYGLCETGLFDIVSTVAGQKCPCCGKRDAKHIGRKHAGDRAYGGVWKTYYASYRQCQSCRSTWYTTFST